MSLVDRWRQHNTWRQSLHSCWSVRSVNTPQASASLCDVGLINVFRLSCIRSVDEPLAAWQVPVSWGFIISVSPLICIVRRNVRINLCPRPTFGAPLRPCSHLCVSEASLQNENYSIWKIMTPTMIRKKKTNSNAGMKVKTHYGNT